MYYPNTKKSLETNLPENGANIELMPGSNPQVNLKKANTLYTLLMAFVFLKASLT